MGEDLTRRRSAIGLALLASALLALPAAAADEIPLDTERDKALYAIGVFMGRNFRQFDLSEAEFERVAAGVRDAALNRQIRASVIEYQGEIEVIQNERRQRALDRDAQLSADYLAQVAAEAGVERSESGLLFQSRSAGEGEVPGPRDRVVVHYEGRLRDGTVFDSTHVRGAPAVFPLDGVIACWTEGLQRMRPGGNARIVCPAALAYGQSPPPGVPVNAPLSFEVELLRIEP